MLDKFGKALQSGNKNSSQFRLAVSKLRQEISPSSYKSLQNRIRKSFPKYVKSTLLPSRREKWSDLKYLSCLTKPLKLENEVAWQAFQLQDCVGRINKHVSLLGEFTRVMNSNDLGKAGELLDEHYKEHGATLWNLEARIALASRSRDDSAEAEELVLQLKPDIEGSLLYLVCYIFSDLYDQATTYGGFSSRVKEVMSGYEGSLIPRYLKVKLLRDSFTSLEL